jgi:two-component system, chemotaxis family, response regulator WspR
MSHSQSAAGIVTPEHENVIRVLLVDDQPMVGEAVRRALHKEPNVEFHYCANPVTALGAAKEIKPTVILQDLVMPNVNGLQLVCQYRADPATSGVPIIVLSSKEEPTVKSEAFKVGANDYLVKLPDQIELIARIRYHSMAYMNQLQRDDAYRALRESQQQLIETNLELQRLTNIDGLTGLSNRRYFNEYMEAEWKRAMRSQNPLSILMIDVDHFKQYNDTYGHIAGDDVLRKVAQCIMQGCGRPTDLAARYGGEEFVVILPETPFAGTLRLAESYCHAVEALKLVHSASTAGSYVTISVGGSTTLPQRAGSFFALVDAADKCLYASKKGGRNRATVRDLGSLLPLQPHPVLASRA